MKKLVDLIKEFILLSYQEDCSEERQRRDQRHFEFENLTFLAAVSFKPIRTRARVCVISSHCAGSSILARAACARIHLNKGNKE